MTGPSPGEDTVPLSYQWPAIDETTPLPTLSPAAPAPQAAPYPVAPSTPSAAAPPAASPAAPAAPPAPDPTTQLPYPTAAPPGTHLSPPAPGRARARIGAASLVLALLAGGAGGVGGAAAWSAFTDEGSGSTPAAPTSTTQRTTRVDPAPVVDGSVESVAGAVLPSVVQIKVSGAGGSGSGSGIILTADGRILTNNHVVDLAGQDGTLSVSFNDGRKAPATIVGTDPKTDSAVIQATGVTGLTPASVGDSGALQVGHQVVAIGSPYGLDATVTTGIVSALNRPVSVSSDAVYPAIQTDAAINPGNSGGPLVNMDGQVVGVNASIRGVESASGEAGSIGLGFAIPINELMPIVDQIVAGETPTHARFGITVGDAPDDAAAAGAVVGDVTPVSAADKAGLRSGDVITSVDGHRITGAESLIATVRSYRPGDQVEVTYVRDSKSATATLTLDSDGQDG
ncbi:MAG: trypsin-like peptidase domain-containing protein [Nocardioides sp.]